MKEHRMGTGRKQKSIPLSLAGSVCLGGAVLFLESTVMAGFLSTLGLLLLLCGGRCADTRPAILLNGVFLWLGHSVRYCGLFGTEFIYALFCFLALIPYCGVLTVALFLDRRLYRSGRPLLAALVLPGTYALCAFLLAALNFGFVSNIMSYLMCIPVIAVNLSWLGEYGMTFVLLLILMCFSATLSKSQKQTKLVFASVSLLLSASLLISGTALRAKWKEPDYTIKVALATSQEMDFTGESGTVYTRQQQLDMFTAAMKQAIEDDAKLLVLNEEYFLCSEENTDTMLSEISQIVRQYGIPSLIAMEIVCQDGPDINEAVYYDADGQLLYTYIKNNLVPFIEAGYFVDGVEEPAILHTSIDGHSLDLAFVICYDVNDEAYLRKIPSSTELLLVPSWDWDTENLEQKRTAIRSASLGLTMLKHSFDGFSHVSCPDGSCAAEVDLRGCYETVKTVSVPIWER